MYGLTTNRGKGKAIVEVSDSTRKRAKIALKPNTHNTEKLSLYVARPNIMLPSLVTHYKDKYNIDTDIVRVSRYNQDISYNNANIRNALDNNHTKGLIFMSTEDPEHCTAFIIHDRKILQLLNEQRYNLFVINILKDKFQNEYFTADSDVYRNNSYNTHPQGDETSCAILAMKIIKNLLIDNQFLLTQSVYDEKNNLFYPHPEAFKHSQSDNFINTYKEHFKNLSENNDFKNLDKYREKYGKSRLNYFSLSHSPQFIKAINKGKISF